MTHHMNAEEQATECLKHLDALLLGNDQEWTAAALAMCETATDHVTGYGLAGALAHVIRTAAQQIQEHGQTPVTAHDVPTTADEQSRMAMSLRYIQAAIHPDEARREQAYELFCRIERHSERDPKALSSLFFHLAHIAHQMGEQLKQAKIDSEATR